MSEIRIKRVIGQNFMSIKQANLSFENRGLVGVYGPNGCGKSALFVELFLYAVYGSLMRYQKDLGTQARIGDEEVVNRFVQGNCMAQAQLDVEGDNVEISTFRNHDRFKNEIFFTVNGEDRRGANNDRTREKIVKLLDMDYITVTNSVILGQSLAEYFSGMKDEDQKKVVDRLLNMLWISQALEVTKKDLFGLDKKMEDKARTLELIELKIDAGVKKLEQLEISSDLFEKSKLEKIDKLKSSELTFEANKKVKILNLEESSKNFEITKKNRMLEVSKLIESEKKVDILVFEHAVKQAEDELSRVRNLTEVEKAAIDEETGVIRGKKDGLSKLRSDLEKEMLDQGAKVATEQANITHCEKNISEVNVRISKVNFNNHFSNVVKDKGVCEYCGSVITAKTKLAYLTHLQEDLRDKTAELDALKLGYSSAQALYMELVVKKKQLVAEEAQLEKQLRLLQDKPIPSQKRLDQAKSKLQEAKDSLKDAKSKNDMVDDRLKGYGKRSWEIASEINPYLEMIKAAKAEENPYILMIVSAESEVNPNLGMIKKAEEEIHEFNDGKKNVKAELDSMSEQKPYYDFWVEGFSNRGLKSLIIDSMVPRMNQWSDIYSAGFGDKFDITFSALKALKSGELREKFDVGIYNKFGSTNYRGNSGGERRLIDIIVMFVLGDLAASRSSKRFSCLILDEVFERLDEEICDTVIEMLRWMGMPKDQRPEVLQDLPSRESIFVLTHQPFWKDKLENNVKVFRNENDETDYTERTT